MTGINFGLGFICGAQNKQHWEGEKETISSNGLQTALRKRKSQSLEKIETMSSTFVLTCCAGSFLEVFCPYLVSAVLTRRSSFFCLYPKEFSVSTESPTFFIELDGIHWMIWCQHVPTNWIFLTEIPFNYTSSLNASLKVALLVTITVVTNPPKLHKQKVVHQPHWVSLFTLVPVHSLWPQRTLADSNEELILPHSSIGILP